MTGRGLRVGLASAAPLPALAAPATASAADRFVDQGGTDAGVCTSSASPCGTIEYAVGQSASGDRVLVGSGTYDEALVLLDVSIVHDEQIFAGGNGGAIIDNGAVADLDDTSNAILAGDDAVIRGFNIRSPTRAIRTIGAATISGNFFDQSNSPSTGSAPNCQEPLIEIGNGNGVARITGNAFSDPTDDDAVNEVGVCVPEDTEPVISSNGFDNLVNAVRLEGGGGDSGDSIEPVISDNAITHARNGASPGAGIFVRGMEPEISGNIIRPSEVDPSIEGISLRAVGGGTTAETGAALARNDLHGFAKGVYLDRTGAPVSFDSDVIVDNGVGIWAEEPGSLGRSHFDADNVTVYDSTSANGEIHLQDEASATLTSSIIGTQGIVDLDSSSCAIAGSRGPVTGSGCDNFATTSDPGFTNPFTYHLAADSPMIDAGGTIVNPGARTDIDGDPRQLDGDCPEDQPASVDIGADEFNCVPETAITKGPEKIVKTKSKTAKVTITSASTDPGSTFECKLDAGAFKPCAATASFKLKPGKHTIQVRATDGQGQADATPAQRSVKVKRKKKKKRNK